MKVEPSPLFYAELALFLVPLLFGARRRQRSGATLHGPKTPREARIGLFAGDEGLARKILRRWGPLAQAASDENPTVPTPLILGVIHESSRGNPKAQQKFDKGEGLMALTPAMQQDFSVSDPFDPAENIEGGTRYLARLIQETHGDLLRAVARYHGTKAHHRISRNSRAYATLTLQFAQMYKELL